MKWSVVVVADGDRIITREEVVELADAVAVHHGIASGIGSASYGAQIIVDATTRAEAETAARGVLTDAAATAGLPPWTPEVVESTPEDVGDSGSLP